MVQKNKKIISKMTISEVLKKYPKTISVFVDYGLYCANCPMAQNDSIKDAAEIHNLNLKKLLSDLSKAAKKL